MTAPRNCHANSIRSNGVGACRCAHRRRECGPLNDRCPVDALRLVRSGPARECRSRKRCRGLRPVSPRDAQRTRDVSRPAPVTRGATRSSSTPASRSANADLRGRRHTRYVRDIAFHRDRDTSVSAAACTEHELNLRLSPITCQRQVDRLVYLPRRRAD